MLAGASAPDLRSLVVCASSPAAQQQFLERVRWSLKHLEDPTALPSALKAEFRGDSSREAASLRCDPWLSNAYLRSFPVELHLKWPKRLPFNICADRLKFGEPCFSCPACATLSCACAHHRANAYKNPKWAVGL